MITKPSIHPFKQLSSGETATTVKVNAGENPAKLAAMLNLPPSSGLLMLSGGAGQMSSEMRHHLMDLFIAIGDLLSQLRTTVIDGGTRSGVMALMGNALAQAHHAAPYIGILPAHAEVEPGGLQGKQVLEPQHSHFVLVESSQWGEEVELMYGLAGYLSQQAASVALLVNGGVNSLKEVEWNIRQGREIIVIEGSGRLADEIASAVKHPEVNMREPIATITRKGRLTLFNLEDSAVELVQLLRQRLTPQISE